MIASIITFLAVHWLESVITCAAFFFGGFLAWLRFATKISRLKERIKAGKRREVEQEARLARTTAEAAQHEREAQRHRLESGQIGARLETEKQLADSMKELLKPLARPLADLCRRMDDLERRTTDFQAELRRTLQSPPPSRQYSGPGTARPSAPTEPYHPDQAVDQWLPSLDPPAEKPAEAATPAPPAEDDFDFVPLVPQAARSAAGDLRSAIATFTRGNHGETTGNI